MYLICGAYVAVPKKCKVERHFKTVQKNFNIDFPINIAIRVKKISDVKICLTKQ